MKLLAQLPRCQHELLVWILLCWYLRYDFNICDHVNMHLGGLRDLASSFQHEMIPLLC